MMHVALAFGALGFLIGNLVGLTAESVVGSLVGLIFAFGGGSAIGFLTKLAEEARKVASVAILSLSIACLAGTYLGIAVSEYQLLTPAERRVERAKASIAEGKYLRAYLVNTADEIDQLKATGVYTSDQAYQELYKLLSQTESE